MVISSLIIIYSNVWLTFTHKWLIKAKNTKELQAKKALLQADLTKIDEALSTLEVKKEE